jgi:hypothetical protein
LEKKRICNQRFGIDDYKCEHIFIEDQLLDAMHSEALFFFDKTHLVRQDRHLRTQK